MSVPPSVRVAPRRHSTLRRAAFRAAEELARVLGGRAYYRRAHLRRPGLRVREERVRVRGLAPGLEGFTLVQLSDFHAGSFLRSGDLADVVEASNALAPDVVALTGDFLTHSCDEALPLAADFARLRAREGVFAVFGNHDYRERREDEIVRAYAGSGVRFLRDACVRIERGGAALALVGIEDLEEAKRVDLQRARSLVRTGDVEIVLCHNPSSARALARPGCAAILSGHTHGGQIDLPFLARLGPKHPGARVQLGETLLVVSRGIGAIGVPVRIRAPAEIVVLRLSRA